MSSGDDGVDLTLEVDETGEIVEISRGARRRLAAVAGRWHLVPSPPGLLLLRRADAEANAPAGAPRPPSVALAGELAGPGVLADVINFIHFNQWDGVLSVVEGGARRSLTFQKGQVLAAASNLPEDRLGALLVRFGQLSGEDLTAAVREVTPQRRLGTILIEKGLLSAHDLYEGVRRQVEEIFYAVLLVRRGAFYVTRDSEAQPVARLHLDTQGLLLEGLRRIDEMAYFRAKLSGPDVVLVRRSAPPESLAGEALAVYRFVDDRRTLGEIARAAKLGEFAATRGAFELLQRGAVQVRASAAMPSKRGRDTLSPDASVAMASAYATALGKVHALTTMAGRGTVVKEGVTAFLAGVAHDGALGLDALLANARATPDGNALLAEALRELFMFVLFLATDILDRGQEQAIHDELARALDGLPRP